MPTPFEQWQIIIHFAAQKEIGVDRLSKARGYTFHNGIKFQHTTVTMLYSTTPP